MMKKISKYLKKISNNIFFIKNCCSIFSLVVHRFLQENIHNKKVVKLKFCQLRLSNRSIIKKIVKAKAKNKMLI